MRATPAKRAARPTPAGRDGYALVAVLWLLILASALAAELHAALRADRHVTANVQAEARARWAARAGLARTVEALRSRLATAAPGGTGLGVTDTLLIPVLEMDVDGVRVVATATDARAKLNLNAAAPQELRMLFAALGREPGRAASLASAVARWRAAHLPPVEAAPDTTRVRLRPSPGAFAAVEDLRNVPAMTETEYLAAAPYLTVVSDGRINLNTAPVPVLMTLAGMDERTAALLVERRRRTPLSTPYDAAAPLPNDATRQAEALVAAIVARGEFAPREAEVRVVAAPPGAAVRGSIRAVAVMTGGTRLPVVQVVER